MSAHPGRFVNRHVYTSAPSNFPGGGGFKTVACVADLRTTGALKAIESLVESYSNREGGGAVCRQFVPLTPVAQAYALTVFTPLGFCPDGRTGNFWAETQVVPSEWLEQANWDAGAAFAALSWLGPRDVADLHQDPAPEPLPHLEPRALDSLARLNELVPPDRLETLLQAVAQQSRALKPLWLLEAQGDPPSALEEIVLLLPLVVPPTSRQYRDGELHRCLTLRTRCLRGMAPPTDITGYPAAAADNLNSTDGFLIDLAGRLPMPSFGDRFGRDYAEWLRGVIQEGEWDKLAHLFKQAANSPGLIFFAQHKSLLQAPSRSRGKASSEASDPLTAAPERAEKSKFSDGAAPTSPLGAATHQAEILSPVQERQRAWTARDQTEGALWDVLKSHESQLEELIGKIRRDFAAELEKTRTKLLEDVAVQRKGLEANLQSIEKDIKNAGKRSQQQSASLDRESSAFKARFEKLEREIAEVKKRMSELGSVLPEDPTVVPVVKAPEKRSFRDMLLFSRDWLRGHRWIAWGAGIGIGLALLGVIALRGTTGNVPLEWFDRNELEARKASTEALLNRVEEGKVAARLLESATMREDVAPQAHVVTLAITLRHGIPVDDKLDCAFLQAALQEDAPDVPVLGICGKKTIDSLVGALMPECCKKFQAPPMDEKKLRNCFVTDRLQLALQRAGHQEEACDGESPWRKGRTWTEEESSHALALFQRASKAYKGDPDSELDKALRSLDPAQSPSLRQRLAGETLTRVESKRVLELAWVAWSGREERLGKLSAKKLEELGQLVDQVAPRADEVPPQGGVAPATADGAR